MTTAFSLYLISPETALKDEIEVLTQLFNAGLKNYHLRKPGWSIEQTRSFLQLLTVEFHQKVVLHSHFELAKEFKLKGIHLNENNKKHISQLAGYRIISASFHNLNDITENQFPFEYVFLSPIFDSISKVGYNSNFDLKTLTSDLYVLNEKNPAHKIVALAGINAQNIHTVKETGFSGAALLGAVWQSENPVRAFIEIQSITNATD